MIANQKRKLKPGNEYNALIPASKNQEVLRHKLGSTDDGIRLMKSVTLSTLDQTRRLAEQLRSATLYDTCKRIWNFVYDHIQYEKDRAGKEDIRHPARTWADRARGVDCDDYSVFIGSILMNLNIPFKFRVTAYGGDWQHVYVIVPTDGDTRKGHHNTSDYITIDCVPDSFDYEVPYTKKKDIPMIPTYELSGIPGLGRSTKRQARIDKRQAKKADRKAARAEYRAAQTPGQQTGRQRKTIFGKALQKIGRGVAKVAASPVRSAWLLAMKINFKRVATRLRWAYATPELAQQNGITQAQYQAIRNQLLRIQNVFYKAGGEAANLKNAILKGAGNKDRKVPLSGLVGFGYVDAEYEELPTVEQLVGMGGLGVIDPATLTSLGVIMAALVELAKNLDGILPANSAEGDYSYEYEDEAEYEYYADGYEGIGKIKLFAKKKGKDEPTKPLVAATTIAPKATTLTITPPSLPAVTVPVTPTLSKKEQRKEKKVTRQANRIEKRADRKARKVPGAVATTPELVAKAQQTANALQEKQAAGQKLNLKERKALVQATAISKKAVAVAQNPDLAKSKKQLRQEKRADRKVTKKPLTTEAVAKAETAQTILTEKAKSGQKLTLKEQRDLATANAVLKIAASKPETILSADAVQSIPQQPKKVTVQTVLQAAGNVIQKAAQVANTANAYNEQVQQIIQPAPVVTPPTVYAPAPTASTLPGGFSPYEEVSSGPLVPNALDDTAIVDDAGLESQEPKKSSGAMLALGAAAIGLGIMLFGGDEKGKKSKSATRSQGLSGTPRRKSARSSGNRRKGSGRALKAPVDLW